MFQFEGIVTRARGAGSKRLRGCQGSIGSSVGPLLVFETNLTKRKGPDQRQVRNLGSSERARASSLGDAQRVKPCLL